MPVYDYKCSKCNRTIEVFVQRRDVAVAVLCLGKSGCGGTMTQLPAIPNMHLFPEGGIHLKHVCPGGKTFHSKNEMRKYAVENNLELGALL